MSAASETTTTTTTSTPFLDELSKSKKVCGDLIFLFEGFLNRHEAGEAMTILNSDLFPWDLNPKLGGERLSQHAYFYDRRRTGTKNNKNHRNNNTTIMMSPGIKKLEEICIKIEAQFDGKVAEVYCNRFEDPSHHIPWHKDTYGRHIFVLSLGSQRKIQFRNNNNQEEVYEVIPKSGDLYFMPLAINDTHKHQVLSADDADNGSGTRLSFVFFFETPAYATEYRITMKDKIKGFWESLIS